MQNFVSAAVGIAVVATLIRGFTRNRTDRLGNFWVDLTRILILRLMLPFSIVFALVLVASGVVQSLGDHLTVVHTINGDQSLYTGATALAGGHQGARHQRRRHLQRQLRASLREPQRRSRTCSRSTCCW